MISGLDSGDGRSSRGHLVGCVSTTPIASRTESRISEEDDDEMIWWGPADEITLGAGSGKVPEPTGLALISGSYLGSLLYTAKRAK